MILLQESRTGNGKMSCGVLIRESENCTGFFGGELLLKMIKHVFIDRGYRGVLIVSTPNHQGNGVDKHMFPSGILKHGHQILKQELITEESPTSLVRKKAKTYIPCRVIQQH